MLDAQSYLRDIFDRLPYHVQMDYLRDESWKNGPIPSYMHLLEYVERRAHLSNTFYGRLMAERYVKSRQQVNPRPRSARTYTTTSSTITTTKERKGDNKATKNTQIQCLCCGDSHFLYNCTKFKDKDTKQRRDFVREYKACFNCLRAGHNVKDCRSTYTCQVNNCGKKHHTLLHDDTLSSQKPVNSNAKSSGSNGPGVSNVHANFISPNIENYPVRLMVVPVKVSANDSDRYSFTYAFFDYGSSRSFCTTDLAKSLGLQGETEECTIHTASGSKPHSGKRVSLTITGINEPNEICVNNILTFDGIPDLRDSSPHQDIVEQYPHLHGLSFPEVNGTIEVLIGSDVLGQFPISDTCVGEQGSPTAYHTMLGWTLAGPDNNAQISNCVDVNFLKADHSSANSIEESNNLSMCHICGHDFVDLYADPCTTEFSVDDKKALSIMADTVKMVNGRYQIALPWVSDNVTLPNNRFLAEKRLMYLKRKFLKDPDLFPKYKDKIHEYIQNGYAEYIPIHELPHSNRTSYLPHHYTCQKCRVVFDCSAEFQGTCLNNNLLSGPFNTNTLVGVLLRFRREPVAVICDIRQMFHWIRVNPPDCDSMRFLWWHNDDLSRDPVELKMLSHIFGCKSSPSVATFALRKVADDNLSNADSVTIETVNRNFFVDDCLKSLPTADQTVSLISQLRKLLDTCGFHLAKFISNDQAVLDSIPDEDKAPSMVDFDIQDCEYESPFPPFFIRYSKFEKLQRAMVWLIRFQGYTKWKYLKCDQVPASGFISVEELRNATHEMVKLVQSESMPLEMKYFKQSVNSCPPTIQVGQKQKLKSPLAKPLLKCDPFIQDGVMRMRGRLEKSDLPAHQKNPIILPPHHHVTKLIIDMHHRNTGHSGTLHVLAAVRERFWILRGQSAVGKSYQRVYTMPRKICSYR
ncbi:uncharacterized protein LOC120343839 [Styela clava]